ncbi:hypothetical protein F383_28425 [Gossypium arboreum]|uniref:Uncharacterized protein n=1 Tax=Gossypium arboreum TaxID=29729 RepID=A0A0B0PAG5_GOSAR|nr:hypothetical protein F383_25608 [Gossypium arboreum]KHG21802.1 hypothetical protein F383_28425 [Gossypium arboreum]
MITFSLQYFIYPY